MQSIKFKKDWYLVLETLPEGIKRKFLAAIMDYAFYGIRPVFEDERINALWEILVVDIDMQKIGED